MSWLRCSHIIYMLRGSSALTPRRVFKCFGYICFFSYCALSSTLAFSSPDTSSVIPSTTEPTTKTKDAPTNPNANPWAQKNPWAEKQTPEKKNSTTTQKPSAHHDIFGNVPSGAYTNHYLQKNNTYDQNNIYQYQTTK